MTGKQEGPYKGEETKAEEDKLWQHQVVEKQWINFIFNEFPDRISKNVILLFT